MKVLALNVNGDITYCTVPKESRGKGRCNHIEHQNENESLEHFIERIEFKQKELIEQQKYCEKEKEISQKEINELANKIDKIAGEKITQENFKEVISKLNPKQIAEITKLSFEAAPAFSLPITDENYNDENIKNKLYFANLPAYGIGGNASSVAQMFDKVGIVPTLDENVEVEHSYKEGLTPSEYFSKQFSSRDATINKGVSTSKPGYCIYENSLIEIKEDTNCDLNKILWKDVQIGNVFADGSIVTNIEDWTQKECFKLKIEDFDEITLSHDHLLNGEIFVKDLLITNLEHSENARKNIGEKDQHWICARDIFEFYKMGAKIILNDDKELKYIALFKNGEQQKVRCISTSTGFYETNGLIHHNTARKLFYAMSDTQVAKDCGGPYINAMNCKMPEGHVCEKCALLTKGGENIKSGQLIGGWVSTNMSEALTQLSMKQMHVGNSQVTSQQNNSKIIMATLDGWSNSQIIQKMREDKTTEEMRNTLYEGLKEQYQNAGIKQDDFNLMMVAKKLTSYKRDSYGLRPVNPGEKCDIISMEAAGSFNNIFKVSELSSGYKYLTSPITQEIKQDASNQILK